MRRAPRIDTYRLGMVPLQDRDVQVVRHLFDSPHLSFVVDAVSAGNSPARVWADDVSAPRMALIWGGTHSLYLAGTVDQPAEWRELFDREIAPRGLGLLKAYVTADAAETVFAG